MRTTTAAMTARAAAVLTMAVNAEAGVKAVVAVGISMRTASAEVSMVIFRWQEEGWFIKGGAAAGGGRGRRYDNGLSPW